MKYQLFYWGRIWLASGRRREKTRESKFWSESQLYTLEGENGKNCKFSGEVFPACLAPSDLCWLGSFGSNSASHGQRGGYRGFGRRQKYFVQRLLGINQTESQSRISPTVRALLFHLSEGGSQMWLSMWFWEEEEWRTLVIHFNFEPMSRFLVIPRPIEFKLNSFETLN